MHYIKRGEVAKRPHLDLPEGSFEEELGLQGFFGPVAHIYHRNPPTGWSDLKMADFQWPQKKEDDAPSLRPQCFRSLKEEKPQDFFEAYRCFFFNDDVEIGGIRSTKESPVFFRNADASEVYFCHSGSGRLESVFGDLSFKKADYIFVPKGTTYRFRFSEEVYLLRIQSFGEDLKKPEMGILGRQALYHEESIRIPELMKNISNESSRVWVQSQMKLSEIVYPFSVLDVVGWCGDFYPFALSMNDIAPAMSPVAHLPPSINSTFLNSDFVICTFLPRPLEEPEGALKVPFYHSNIDYDEVIFYHDGDFFSRDHMEAGYTSLHPRGINHGPHPKALKNQSKMKRTEEMAVMVDTKRPLKVNQWARSLEEKDYWKSWKA